MKALITGITGQDGSYLAEYLLDLNYEVHGIIRRSSTFNSSRIEHLLKDNHEKYTKKYKLDNLYLHYGDLADQSLITKLIYDIKPNEIYHLGAQSHVGISFDMPNYTGEITGLGTTKILEAIKQSGIDCKFYQASTSELFGASEAPQNENTIFQPRSPYACAKLYSYWMAKNYRDGYNLKTYNGILFNHESPRRGKNFVTRKITYGLNRVLTGKQEKIYLGNLNAKRDWGFAGEYVKIMHKILQQDDHYDFVIGTGKTYTIRDFIDIACKYLDIKLEWIYEGNNEKGLVTKIKNNPYINNGSILVEIDPKYFRPTEVHTLMADTKKMKKYLNYTPNFELNELVWLMLDSDFQYNFDFKTAGDGLKIAKEKGYTKWSALI